MYNISKVITAVIFKALVVTQLLNSIKVYNKHTHYKACFLHFAL